MPTLIGTDTLTSISRRIILPQIVDQIYTGNALFYRLNAANKKSYEGGLHIEQPFIYQTWTSVGSYSGFDLLDTTPQDNVKNGGWDLKQYYASCSIDTRTLARANSELAVANILTLQWEQARMGLSDRLGTDFWGSGVSDTTKIDGLEDIVDDGSVATSYAGLTRSSNTYLNATIDSTTTTLTMSSLRSMVSSLTKGGHTPSSIWSRGMQYNRYWALNQGLQQYPTGPAMVDSQFANAGFTHLWFDQIPWIVEDKVGDGATNSSNSDIVFLNEDLLQVALWSNTDFEMEDFRKPVNQQALVGFLHWWGNLIHSAPQLNGKMTTVVG